jgi:hypothetical protein
MGEPTTVPTNPHWQVVITDLQDFIIEYKNFEYSEKAAMLEYVALYAGRRKRIIKITRWGYEGRD